MFSFFYPEERDTEIESPSLYDLQVGWYVDFNLKTLKVKEVIKNIYDDDYESNEWRLEDLEESVYFLESYGDRFIIYEEADLSKAVVINDSLKGHFERRSNDEFPLRIQYEHKTFSLLKHGTLVRKNKTLDRKKSLTYGDYESRDGIFLTVRVYNKNEIEIKKFREVEEYQFENLVRKR